MHSAMTSHRLASLPTRPDRRLRDSSRAHRRLDAGRALVTGTDSLLISLFLWIAAAALLFEEWFWRRSTRAIAKFAFAAHLSGVETWMRRRSPAQALALFVLPLLVIYPFKALALVALARGSVVLGSVAFIAAKLVATAVFARLYQLTEPAILHFRWVAKTKAYVQKARRFLHAWLDARPAYRVARAAIRAKTDDLAFRYRAVRRLHRRRAGFATRCRRRPTPARPPV
jgi:hypothetical protein